MTAPVRAAIALGSNLDHPEAHVARGFNDIAALPGTKVLARSSLYRTKPVGYADQPDFVNACALVETSLEPRELLEGLMEIERAHGRKRGIRNGPRTLDLDIILYGDRLIDEPDLTIPHPRALERDFVMNPLHEVWPEAVFAKK
ncbi:MAG: 2-amino-4-hydroxy-6-hydroxymethyldihydropteridine diphosphokinase [Usitatibacter sp.]